MYVCMYVCMYLSVYLSIFIHTHIHLYISIYIGGYPPSSPPPAATATSDSARPPRTSLGRGSTARTLRIPRSIRAALVGVNPSPDIYLSIYLSIYVYVYVYVYVYLHLYLYRYTYVYIYIYISTIPPSPLPPLPLQLPPLLALTLGLLEPLAGEVAPPERCGFLALSERRSLAGREDASRLGACYLELRRAHLYFSRESGAPAGGLRLARLDVSTHELVQVSNAI